MKNAILLLVILIPFSQFFLSCNNEIETCTITGKVIGRSSDTLIVMNALDHPWFAKTKIPITDSTFSYVVDAKPAQAYWLVFQDEIETGGFRPITFFPDARNIYFTLHSMDQFDRNVIEGGKMNNQFREFGELLETTFKGRYQPLNDSIRVLFETNQYNSDSMSVLYERLRQSKSQDTNIVIYDKMEGIRERGNHLSKKAEIFEMKLKEISREQSQLILEYLEDYPTIVTYYLFIDRCLINPGENVDITSFNKIQEVLSDKFKDHPYRQRAEDLLNSLNVRVGGKFIDFTLPDLGGKNHQLSELIDGKIALINLWATWCGPCIATSRTMIPVYNEYKNKGFTIVAAAAEIDNTDRLRKTLEREKFPWINLVELDHQNNIWNKYGIPNAAGKTILVDRNGEILAIDPTAEEVRKVLVEKL
jgi:thiol-disulfide isomerase/thioredoxin